MEQSIFETPGGPRSEQSCVLRLKMSNYFSCGIESRIGVGFDRYRTKSQLLNKMVKCSEKNMRDDWCEVDDSLVGQDLLWDMVSYNEMLFLSEVCNRGF